MASDREEERQSESESSVDIRELLPRDGPITQFLSRLIRRGRVT